jgi:hypothetical protein
MQPDHNPLQNSTHFPLHSTLSYVRLLPLFPWGSPCSSCSSPLCSLKQLPLTSGHPFFFNLKCFNLNIYMAFSCLYSSFLLWCPSGHPIENGIPHMTPSNPVTDFCSFSSGDCLHVKWLVYSLSKSLLVYELQEDWFHFIRDYFQYLEGCLAHSTVGPE